LSGAVVNRNQFKKMPRVETGTYTITVSDGSRTVTATTTLSATTTTDRGPLTRRHQLLTVRR
jgi:hypothetical protein